MSGSIHVSYPGLLLVPGSEVGDRRMVGSDNG